VDDLRFKLARALLSAALLSSTACSEVLDIPDDPKLVDGTDPWRCLGKPLPETVPERDTASVSVHACNFVSSNCSATATGFTANLCDKKDVNCTNPIATNIGESAGDLQFDVPTGGVLGVGFDGYLQIAARTELCTNKEFFPESGQLLCALSGQACDTNPTEACRYPIYAPARLFFNPAIKSDVTTPIPLPLFPLDQVQPILTAANQPLDPTKGFVFITALDCNGTPAKDVSYSISRNDPSIAELYVAEGNISGGVSHTDETGLGGFLGVPAGFTEVFGALGDDSGQRIGAAGVYVGAFSVSYTTLTPSP
jgi:hypothetical protein